MSYGNTASNLRNGVSSIKNSTSNIGNINFDSIWSGDAHTKLMSNLDEVVDRYNAECNNLENFSNALDLLEQYKLKKEEMERLQSQLNSLSDDKEHASERVSLKEQINKLQDELNSLKSQILGMIKFDSNTVNYEVVTFQTDESSYKDFTYIVDIENLKGLAENDLLISLTENETLYDYYSKEEVDNTLASIKDTYSGREAAVNCTLAMIQMAANVGKKLRYGGSRDVYDIGIKSDCAVFASWAVNQGTTDPDGFDKRNVAGLSAAGDKYKYYEEALPGDVLYHFGAERSDYHATFLVQNDTENKKVIIAEASGVRNGVRLREMSYDTLKKMEYRAVNMSPYYD